MKVYIISYSDYDWHENISVCATPELAEKQLQIEKDKKRQHYHDEYYDIEILDVITDIHL